MTASFCVSGLRLLEPPRGSDRRICATGDGNAPSSPQRRKVISLSLLALAGGLTEQLLWPHRAAEAAHGRVEGMARVVDGDTVVINKERIRLLGIDAPELKQTCKDRKGDDYPCGFRSKKELESLVAGKPLRCEFTGEDRYGREIGVCYNADGVDVNAKMVEKGWATAYPKYSKSYVRSEDEARRARRGMWNGAFETPEDYRRQNLRGGSPSHSSPSK